MRIRYDPEVDALSISFRDTTVTTQELAEGIAGEYDAQGQLVGIEILDAAKRTGDLSAFRQVILEGVGPAALASTGKP
jgi:YD repeat-containing protein